jgi:hypothetical protein
MAFTLLLENEIPAYIYIRLYLAYFAWNCYHVYRTLYLSLYDVQFPCVWEGSALYYIRFWIYISTCLLHISVYPKKKTYENMYFTFVEEQFCSIVIEFLLRLSKTKQNKTMCLAANLSWHLLKHFLSIKQINKQPNCQSINDDDSSMYWRASQQ